jgi:hypothetical protein
MASHESAFEAAQRAHWMRPDAHRWIRPDAARFLKPGMKLADVFPTLARKSPTSRAFRRVNQAADAGPMIGEARPGP